MSFLKKESLTPAAQALVGLAMTAATFLTGGTAAGALGITNAVGAAAFNAGAMSFGTQMAINTINNKGDAGKALEDISAKQIAVATAAAALSAGVISHISPNVTPRLDPNFKAGAGAGTKLADMSTTQSASFAGASPTVIPAGGVLPAQAGTGIQAATPSTWAQGFMTRLPVYGVQTVTNVAASAVLADGDPSAIGNAALGSLATMVGSEASLGIGQAYHGTVDPATGQRGAPTLGYVPHKLLHGVVGAGTAAISGGNVLSGAAGAMVAEIGTEAFVNHKLSQGPITEQQAKTLTQQGASLGRVLGGLGGFAAGGDPTTGANTGGVAVQNNALQLLLAAPLVYATVQGKGNPVEGFRDISKGNDPLSQGAAALTEKAVTLSAEHFPEKTAQVLHALSTVDALKDQAIDVIDNATGQRISGTLNTIPKPIRESLLGAAKAYSVVIPAAALTKLNQVAKVAQAAGKVDGPKTDSVWDVTSNPEFATNSGSSFWNKTIKFNGNKVYQRDDLINADLFDSRGRTNLERMQKGLAPVGPDGKSMNLHHMLQSQDGPIAEITATFHKQNHSIIHINPSSIPSGIDRLTFDKWRGDYWRNRGNDFK